MYSALSRGLAMPGRRNATTAEDRNLSLILARRFLGAGHGRGRRRNRGRLIGNAVTARGGGIRGSHTDRDPADRYYETGQDIGQKIAILTVGH